jgi:3D (Asp-Asp-Asp) domain-containing protein
MAQVGIKHLFLTMMAAIVLLASSLNVSANTTYTNEKVAVKVSAYTLTEVYHNNGVMASGKKVKVGYVALSRDIEKKYQFKFGDKVYIEGLGEFEFQDRTCPKKKKWVDVYMTSYAQAKRFGIKKLHLVVSRIGSSVKQD